MAIAVSSPAPARTKSGVVRAGQGHSFLLRRLHSLSGIVPVGLSWSNILFRMPSPPGGPRPTQSKSNFCPVFRLWSVWSYSASGCPYSITRCMASLIFGTAATAISVNIHGLATGCTRHSAGPVQSPSSISSGTPGTCALAAFTCPSHPASAFGKVQAEFHSPWAVAFYAVGIVCASWHFAYGLWLFAAKWGITVGDGARRKFGYACAAIGLVFVLVGAVTMYSFLNTPLQPLDPTGSTNESVVVR